MMVMLVVRRCSSGTRGDAFEAGHPADKIVRDNSLIGIRLPAVDVPVEAGDFFTRFRDSAVAGVFECLFRLLLGKGTVHEVEGLLGNGRLKPARAAGIRGSQVKRSKEIGQILSLNITVDRSPTRPWCLGNIHRPTFHGGIELVGHHQQRVPHGFQI